LNCDPMFITSHVLELYVCVSMLNNRQDSIQSLLSWLLRPWDNRWIKSEYGRPRLHIRTAVWQCDRFQSIWTSDAQRTLHMQSIIQSLS
jgi:hypothetical protein